MFDRPFVIPLLLPICLMALACFNVAGCSQNDPASGRYDTAVESSNWNSPKSGTVNLSTEQDRADFVALETSDADGTLPNEVRSSSTDSPALASETQPSAAANRKIIYTSQLSLEVENFATADAALQRLIARLGGFVANAKIGRLRGKQRHGHWQVRVPVANYQALMTSVGEVGVVVSRQEDAKDVTSEFYDLEARIKNKKRLEERIVGLLDQASGELKRLIEVEHELARVREAIERMEGQKRYLADVTALTTVEIDIKEVAGFIPQRADTFSQRVSNAWQSSKDQFTEWSQNMVVTIVRNALNIVSWSSLVLLVGIAVRIWRRRRQRRVENAI